ncbi:MAG: diacylglycerol kinase family protein [Candidatus Hydrogenedentes bacterium]|nr:diacylglycerol kinase family protein [Candidatus Hydrogenedentota bacterium]
MDRPFQFSGRIRSFQHAFAGIRTMLESQHNAWIHGAATIVVCLAGWYCGLARSEWCWIIAAIVAVWVAEALNTAFEFLADAASPEFHPLVKQAKDVAAGAVLIAAVGSIITGALIFGPRVASLLSSGTSGQ